MNKPDIVIYHNPCTDGFTAAWVVWKMLGSESIRYVGAKYGDPYPDVTGKNVLIVDFSYPHDTMLEIAERAESVTVLDHHDTAQQALEILLTTGVIHGEFDMDRSGAGMAWDAFHPDEPRPRIVEHVEDRDLWKFRHQNTRAFFAYLTSFKPEFETMSQIAEAAQDAGCYGNMILEGSGLLRQHDLYVENLVKQARWLQIGGHLVPVVNTNYAFASDVGNLLTLLPDAPFGATYFDGKDGQRYFSLRSVDEKVDVGAVAKTLGGGGRRNAAAFRFAPSGSVVP